MPNPAAVPTNRNTVLANTDSSAGTPPSPQAEWFESIPETAPSSTTKMHSKVHKGTTPYNHCIANKDWLTLCRPDRPNNWLRPITNTQQMSKLMSISKRILHR